MINLYDAMKRQEALILALREKICYQCRRKELCLTEEEVAKVCSDCEVMQALDLVVSTENLIGSLETLTFMEKTEGSGIE